MSLSDCWAASYQVCVIRGIRERFFRSTDVDLTIVRFLLCSAIV
jgi:hypothetical protein